MTTSAIEWTEHVWNPVIGCGKVSPGCKHCYAEAMHKRLTAMGTPGYDEPFNIIKPARDRLEVPLSRRKPTTYFVNSMSDLFHTDVPDAYITKCMVVMEKAQQHTFQVLTKHPNNMVRYANNHAIPRNVLLGVSVEDRQYGLPRLKTLQRLSAAGNTLFLSIEPLLEDLGELNLEGIGWVIVGGESGPHARPMQPAWVHNIRDQCQAQKVPFFFKQWGTWGADGVKRHKKRNGRTLDGRTWEEMPVNG